MNWYILRGADGLPRGRVLATEPAHAVMLGPVEETIRASLLPDAIARWLDARPSPAAIPLVSRRPHDAYPWPEPTPIEEGELDDILARWGKAVYLEDTRVLLLEGVCHARLTWAAASAPPQPSQGVVTLYWYILLGDDGLPRGRVLATDPTHAVMIGPEKTIRASLLPDTFARWLAARPSPSTLPLVSRRPHDSYPWTAATPIEEGELDEILAGWSHASYDEDTRALLVLHRVRCRADHHARLTWPEVATVILVRHARHDGTGFAWTEGRRPEDLARRGPGSSALGNLILDLAASGGTLTLDISATDQVPVRVASLEQE